MTCIMPCCAASSCTNNASKNCTLSWFGFPLKRPEVKQWIDSCGRAGWSPSRYSVLCSAHFEETCFERDVYLELMGQDPTKRRRRRYLKSGSVPTIFTSTGVNDCRPPSSKRCQHKLSPVDRADKQKCEPKQLTGRAAVTGKRKGSFCATETQSYGSGMHHQDQKQSLGHATAKQKSKNEGALCDTESQFCGTQQPLVPLVSIHERKNSVVDENTLKPGRQYAAFYKRIPRTNVYKRKKSVSDESELQLSKHCIIVCPNTKVNSEPKEDNTNSCTTRRWVVSEDGLLTEVAKFDRRISMESGSMQTMTENCSDVVMKTEVDHSDWGDDVGTVSQGNVDRVPTGEYCNVVIKTEATEPTEVTDTAQEWRRNIGSNEGLCDTEIKPEVDRFDWTEVTCTTQESCGVEIKTEVDKPDPTEEIGTMLGDGSFLSEHAYFDVGETGMKPYLCTTCGRSYSHSRTLSYHERSHSGVRRHTCVVCNKLCASRSNLRQHEMSHATKEPYSCVTCGESYVDFNSFQRHKLSHSSEKKPYMCSVCSRSFRSRAGLKYHVLLHTGEQRFCCAVCDMSFITRTALRKHEQKYTHCQAHDCLPSEEIEVKVEGNE